MGVKVIDSGKWAGIWVDVGSSSVKIASLDGTEALKVITDLPLKFQKFFYIVELGIGEIQELDLCYVKTY